MLHFLRDVTLYRMRLFRFFVVALIFCLARPAFAIDLGSCFRDAFDKVIHPEKVKLAAALKEFEADLEKLNHEPLSDQEGHADGAIFDLANQVGDIFMSPKMQDKAEVYVPRLIDAVTQNTPLTKAANLTRAGESNAAFLVRSLPKFSDQIVPELFDRSFRNPEPRVRDAASLLLARVGKNSQTKWLPKLQVAIGPNPDKAQKERAIRVLAYIARNHTQKPVQGGALGSDELHSRYWYDHFETGSHDDAVYLSAEEAKSFIALLETSVAKGEQTQPYDALALAFFKLDPVCGRFVQTSDKVLKGKLDELYQKTNDVRIKHDIEFLRSI